MVTTYMVYQYHLHDIHMTMI